RKSVAEIYGQLGIDEAAGTKEKRTVLMEAWSVFKGEPAEKSTADAPKKKAKAKKAAKPKKARARRTKTALSVSDTATENLPVLVAQEESACMLTTLPAGMVVIPISPEVLRAGLASGALLLLGAPDQDGIREAEAVFFAKH